MASYSIADEPAVTPNVEIQDIQEQQQQNQQQPQIQQPQIPQMQRQFQSQPPSDLPQNQVQPQQPAKPPPPPQWAQSDQQALDKLTTSEQAIKSRIFSGEYGADEPGVQQTLQAIQKQKAPMMEQKQAAQAATDQQQVQGAMKAAAVQASIENVHRVERAKVFEQGVGKFTDAESGATEHFYEAKPGDWKPIEWKKQQAQSENEPAIYNQMTGQEYQQSLGTPGGDLAAQRIGQSLGQQQPGGQDDFEAIPLAQREAIDRDINRRFPRPPQPTGIPHVDAQRRMQWEQQREVARNQMRGQAAKAIAQKARLGETVESRESREKIARENRESREKLAAEREKAHQEKISAAKEDHNKLYMQILQHGGEHTAAGYKPPTHEEIEKRLENIYASHKKHLQDLALPEAGEGAIPGGGPSPQESLQKIMELQSRPPAKGKKPAEVSRQENAEAMGQLNAIN